MSENDPERSLKWYHLLIFIGVIGLWGFSWWYVSKYQADPGAFGDMFGSINALFSGLAFAGIIITIILQSQELKEQRRELKLTRREFKKQNKTMTLQRFENFFATMLTSIERLDDGTFHVFLVNNIDKKEINDIDSYQKLKEAYQQKHSGRSIEYTANASFNNFFNSFEAVVDFIGEADMSTTESERYYKLYFATLGTHARIVLLYHLNLRTEKRHQRYVSYRHLLFDPIKDSNALYTPHFKLLFDVGIFDEL
jgi:hypothetical protein